LAWINEKTPSSVDFTDAFSPDGQGAPPACLRDPFRWTLEDAVSGTIKAKLKIYPTGVAAPAYASACMVCFPSCRSGRASSWSGSGIFAAGALQARKTRTRSVSHACCAVSRERVRKPAADVCDVSSRHAAHGCGRQHASRSDRCTPTWPEALQHAALTATQDAHDRARQRRARRSRASRQA
jgi:hypothetical protein